jgi:GT2 family glycosyltransferase
MRRLARSPFVSVIVPAHNAAEHMDACLGALAETRYRYHEVIVVDDGSTDATRAIAQRSGARVLSTEGGGRRAEGRRGSVDSAFRLPPSAFDVSMGPAHARNRGAEVARGDLLLFVDADVVITPLTVGDVAAAFAADPELAALFGSYDDAPAHPGFLSQYRNLFHHLLHQQASPEASTFWAGCGAVRRGVFVAAGGFDEERFGPPAASGRWHSEHPGGIEDIELGYRLAAAGCRIRLLKTLQVKHRKRWTLVSMVRCDVLDRAIPWTRLSLERGGLPNHLNVRPTQRLAALCAGLCTASLALAPLQPALLPVALAALAAVVALNAPWYGFLLARRGPLFAARALPVQLLYYHYSAFGLVVGLALHARHRLRGRRLLPTRPAAAAPDMGGGD